MCKSGKLQVKLKDFICQKKVSSPQSTSILSELSLTPALVASQSEKKSSRQIL